MKDLLKRFLLFVEDGAEGAGGGEGKDEKDATEDKSISQSIDDAAAQVEEELKKDDKDGKDDADDKDSESDDSDEDEDEEEEKDLTAEEALHAKNLFKLLTNDKTSAATLKTLVMQAGLELKDIETKAETKIAAKTIKERIREGLGDDYKFLGEKLGTVIESVLADAVKEQTKDIRERQEKQINDTTLQIVKAAQASVTSEYTKIPTNVLEEVLRIQVEQDILPGKATPERYFRTCLTMAAENLGVQLVKKPASTSASDGKKREKSPLENLSESRGSHKEGVNTTQVKSINDAIAKAVDQVEAAKK